MDFLKLKQVLILKVANGFKNNIILICISILYIYIYKECKMMLIKFLLIIKIFNSYKLFIYLNRIINRKKIL